MSTKIHAICDALLGAANLRDIGFHFPDTASEFKGIDSKILLDRVNQLLKKEGYSIGNIDCTLVLEQPKINPQHSYGKLFNASFFINSIVSSVNCIIDSIV